MIWEREAAKAADELGMRVVRVRTGVVLDKDGGALGKMLPFFKAGIGGPVAGGRQLHAVDPRRRRGRDLPARARRRALERGRQRDRARAGHATASSPRRSAARCTARRSCLVPAFAIHILYGEMAEIVTKGQNAIPQRTSSSATNSATRSSTRRCGHALS